MFTRESVFAELKRINQSIPQTLKDFVVTETEKTPAIKLVFEKALEDPSISKEKKEKIKNILDSGKFDQKKLTENDRIAKMIDEYVQREIRKSVKAGRLPTKKQFRELKLNQYDINKEKVVGGEN